MLKPFVDKGFSSLIYQLTIFYLTSFNSQNFGFLSCIYGHEKSDYHPLFS